MKAKMNFELAVVILAMLALALLAAACGGKATTTIQAAPTTIVAVSTTAAVGTTAAPTTTTQAVTTTTQAATTTTQTPTTTTPTTSIGVSPDSIAYAESLGGTSHEGETLYFVIGALIESEQQAQDMLDAATPLFGDMQSYFIVQKSDNFEGLEPGRWVVLEAYRSVPSQDNLDFDSRGFPNAYVERATVRTSDPIPVYEDLVGE